MHKRQISVQEFLEYEQCPHRYLLLKKRREKHSDLKELSERSVNKISSYYFSHIMLGRIPSYKAMLNKWERTWFKDIDISDIITGTYSSTHNNFIRTNTHIASGLNAFCSFWKEGYTPILINECINISGENIYMEISIPAVIRNPSGNLEIVVVSSSSNPKKLLAEKNKRNFYLMQAAFNHQTGHKLPVHLYALGSFDLNNNSKILPYKEDTLKNTKKILEDISNSKFHKTNKCYGCTVKYMCKKSKKKKHDNL